MTKQLDLDFTAAEKARDEALERVEEGAGAAWMAEAAGVILAVARSRREFTTDDIWSVLEPPRNDPRALGAAIRAAIADGVCEATGRFVKSQRVACHRRPVAVWASNVYVGGES